MSIKNYIIFTLSFCIIAGAVSYFLQFGNIYVEKLGLDLPFSLWIVIFILIYTLAYVILFFSSFIAKMVEKIHLNKDFDALLNQIQHQILQKPLSEGNHFSSIHINVLADILKNLHITPKKYYQFQTNDKRIKKLVKTFETLSSIESGKAENIDALGLETDNKFFVKNVKNKIDKNISNALEILRQPVSDELRIYAIEKVLERGDSKDIDKFIEMDIGAEGVNAHILFERYIKHKDISLDALIKILKSMQVSPAEYVDFAIKLQEIDGPDKWYLKLEALAENDENAENGLFYAMCKLGKTEQLKERIKGRKGLINAYLDLLDANLRYPIEIFLSDRAS